MFLDPPHVADPDPHNFKDSKQFQENSSFCCSIRIQILIPIQIYSNLFVKHELGKVSKFLKISAQKFSMFLYFYFNDLDV